MILTVLKIIVVVLALAALSKLVLRFVKGGSSPFNLVLWSVIWGGLIIFVIDPSVSNYLAEKLGFSSRGLSFVSQVAVLFLIYGMYRIVYKIEHIEFEITQLVRNKTLEEAQEKKNPAAAESRRTLNTTEKFVSEKTTPQNSIHRSVTQSDSKEKVDEILEHVLPHIPNKLK